MKSHIEYVLSQLAIGTEPDFVTTLAGYRIPEADVLALPAEFTFDPEDSYDAVSDIPSSIVRCGVYVCGEQAFIVGDGGRFMFMFRLSLRKPHYCTIDHVLESLNRADYFAAEADGEEFHPENGKPLGLTPGEYVFAYAFPFELRSSHTLDANTSAIDIAELAVGDYKQAHASRYAFGEFRLSSLYFEGFHIDATDKRVTLDVTA